MFFLNDSGNVIIHSFNFLMNMLVSVFDFIWNNDLVRKFVFIPIAMTTIGIVFFFVLDISHILDDNFFRNRIKKNFPQYYNKKKKGENEREFKPYIYEKVNLGDGKFTIIRYPDKEGYSIDGFYDKTYSNVEKPKFTLNDYKKMEYDFLRDKRRKDQEISKQQQIELQRKYAKRNAKLDIDVDE